MILYGNFHPFLDFDYTCSEWSGILNDSYFKRGRLILCSSSMSGKGLGYLVPAPSVNYYYGPFPFVGMICTTACFTEGVAC